MSFCGLFSPTNSQKPHIPNKPLSRPQLSQTLPPRLPTHTASIPSLTFSIRNVCWCRFVCFVVWEGWIERGQTLVHAQGLKQDHGGVCGCINTTTLRMQWQYVVICRTSGAGRVVGSGLGACRWADVHMSGLKNKPKNPQKSVTCIRKPKSYRPNQSHTQANVVLRYSVLARISLQHTLNPREHLDPTTTEKRDMQQHEASDTHTLQIQANRPYDKPKEHPRNTCVKSEINFIIQAKRAIAYPNSLQIMHDPISLSIASFSNLVKSPSNLLL